MLGTVVLVVVTVPLQIGFSQLHRTTAFEAMNWVTTGIFMADLVVQFRTGYITPAGEVERDSRLIAGHYGRSHLFVLDLLSALPYQVILASTASRHTAWLGLIKLPRLVRLSRALNALARSSRLANVLSMARLLGGMVMLVHGAVCLWHYLYECLPGWPWAWTECGAQCGGGALAPTYLFGFYQCFLLIVGDRFSANNNVERVFVIALLYIGAFFYAVVVGSMTLLVANMFATATRHKQRAAQVDDALRYRGVSESVRDKVGEFYDYLATNEHPGSEGVAFLQELPVGLHHTVMAELFGPRLACVQLFAYCERPFIWRLAQKLRLSLFMAGDVIYELGSVGHDMFIIWKGAVGLVAPDGALSSLLTDGGHFGELGLMTSNTPRPHRAVSLRPCDVLLLGRWDLQEAMKDFPESAALVKDRSRSRVEDHELAGNLWAAMAGISAAGSGTGMGSGGGQGPGLGLYEDHDGEWVELPAAAAADEPAAAADGAAEASAGGLRVSEDVDTAGGSEASSSSTAGAGTSAGVALPALRSASPKPPVELAARASPGAGGSSSGLLDGSGSAAASRRRSLDQQQQAAPGSRTSNMGSSRQSLDAAAPPRQPRQQQLLHGSNSGEGVAVVAAGSASGASLTQQQQQQPARPPSRLLPAPLPPSHQHHLLLQPPVAMQQRQPSTAGGVVMSAMRRILPRWATSSSAVVPADQVAADAAAVVPAGGGGAARRPAAAQPASGTRSPAAVAGWPSTAASVAPLLGQGLVDLLTVVVRRPTAEGFHHLQSDRDRTSAAGMVLGGTTPAAAIQQHQQLLRSMEDQQQQQGGGGSRGSSGVGMAGTSPPRPLVPGARTAAERELAALGRTSGLGLITQAAAADTSLAGGGGGGGNIMPPSLMAQLQTLAAAAAAAAALPTNGDAKLHSPAVHSNRQQQQAAAASDTAALALALLGSEAVALSDRHMRMLAATDAAAPAALERASGLGLLAVSDMALLSSLPSHGGGAAAVAAAAGAQPAGAGAHFQQPPPTELHQLQKRASSRYGRGSATGALWIDSVLTSGPDWAEALAGGHPHTVEAPSAAQFGAVCGAGPATAGVQPSGASGSGLLRARDENPMSPGGRAASTAGLQPAAARALSRGPSRALRGPSRQTLLVAATTGAAAAAAAAAAAGSISPAQSIQCRRDSVPVAADARGGLDDTSPRLGAAGGGIGSSPQQRLARANIGRLSRGNTGPLDSGSDSPELLPNVVANITSPLLPGARDHHRHHQHHQQHHQQHNSHVHRRHSQRSRSRNASTHSLHSGISAGGTSQADSPAAAGGRTNLLSPSGGSPGAAAAAAFGSGGSPHLHSPSHHRHQGRRHESAGGHDAAVFGMLTVPAATAAGGGVPSPSGGIYSWLHGAHAHAHTPAAAAGTGLYDDGGASGGGGHRPHAHLAVASPVRALRPANSQAPRRSSAAGFQQQQQSQGGMVSQLGSAGGTTRSSAEGMLLLHSSGVGGGANTLPSRNASHRRPPPRRTSTASLLMRPSVTSGGLALSESEGDGLKDLEEDEEAEWSDDSGGGGGRWRERCAALQRQLAAAQAALAESQAALALAICDPMSVPSIATVMRRELEATAAALSGRMERVLQGLLQGVLGVSGRAEEVDQLVAAADDRLQRLEELAAAAAEQGDDVLLLGAAGAAADSVLGVALTGPLGGAAAGAAAGSGSGASSNGLPGAAASAVMGAAARFSSSGGHGGGTGSQQQISSSATRLQAFGPGACAAGGLLLGGGGPRGSMTLIKGGATPGASRRGSFVQPTPVQGILKRASAAGPPPASATAATAQSAAGGGAGGLAAATSAGDSGHHRVPHWSGSGALWGDADGGGSEVEWVIRPRRAAGGSMSGATGGRSSILTSLDLTSTPQSVGMGVGFGGVGASGHRSSSNLGPMGLGAPIFTTSRSRHALALGLPAATGVSAVPPADAEVQAAAAGSAIAAAAAAGAARGDGEVEGEGERD
ncbi:hypothetical protein HXX76_014343 [Chlamydomonas incerta]|uniref:Cyclic nucleotide-binding domain-containing protein n=1 Tax=Chlamydomonas incerta TaxID=51695 RepID=A0A835VSX1_CHLIN|nr:hypothetical protein HXX76_014343 [Chlamydomonas incerta]|eukprot:KAG2424618.1 hypothetical protein HXX76_014343 [Chlamydomonas incerta]